MDIIDSYTLWLEKTRDNAELYDELADISGDEPAITDRFYTELEFGTGGLRGILGAGTNRINIYTIGRCARGLANHLRRSRIRDVLAGRPVTVAIAYDSRRNSELFARTAARIVAEMGIHVRIFPHLMPTPALSYAVRKLGCSAGIVISASHNPAVYNGIMVYGSDGCQITSEDAAAIYKQIKRCDYFTPFGHSFDELIGAGLIRFIGDDIMDEFIADAARQVPVSDDRRRELTIVYTPLHGAGITCVPKTLADAGFRNVITVPEQSEPDGDFPTCPYPNPELAQSLELGVKLCGKVNADLLLATDPDCDRVGTAVRLPDGNYRLLNGNELGTVLLIYILEQRRKSGTLPESPVIIKTIVTTDLTYKIAAVFGAEVMDVLTGFKYIGEQIGLLEKDGQSGRYIFGFEESCSYLCGGYVREKDGVSTSLLVCEAAEYFAGLGLSFSDVLDRAGEKYGWIETKLVNVRFEGAAGAVKMSDIMKRLRENPPAEVNGHTLINVDDYINGAVKYIDNGKRKVVLPQSNVLKFNYSGDFAVVIRPSGTEPQIKLYYFAHGKNKADAAAELKKFMNGMEDIVG